MGRPRKYKTEAERLEGRRRTRKKYYDRNIVSERALALERYHARKDRARASRAASPQPKEKCVSEYLPLTFQFLGVPIIVDESVDLKGLATCLEHDFDSWLEGRADTAVWDDLTTRLLAATGRRRQSKFVLDDIASKRFIAAKVKRYAEEGYQEAWSRRERRNAARLERIAHSATRVESGLEEVISFHEAGGDVLRESYGEEALIWQTT